MTRKLEKHIFCGFDITHRQEMWEEINKLRASRKQDNESASTHINKLQKELELTRSERDKAYSENARLQEKITKANQPREKGKFSGKHDKSAK